jgi:hypothetical protein
MVEFPAADQFGNPGRQMIAQARRLCERAPSLAVGLKSAFLATELSDMLWRHFVSSLRKFEIFMQNQMGHEIRLTTLLDFLIVFDGECKCAVRLSKLSWQRR